MAFSRLYTGQPAGGDVGLVSIIADRIDNLEGALVGESGKELSQVNIDGGSIDGTPIGATTKSTGAFTTLSTTGAATIGNGLTVSAGAITGDGSGITNISSGAFSGDCQLNFSINQKEDTEDSEYDNQIKAQTIPYGSKFTSVTADSERLHRLEVVNVPAHSHEVIYTGSWSNNDLGTMLFGRSKQTSTANDTAVFQFTGVSIGIGVYNTTDVGYFSVELASVSGGVIGTYSKKYTITCDGGAVIPNAFYNLYSGLAFGDYAVKITLIKTSILVSFFSYQTYMVQKPITQYEVYNASYATTIADVPPATSYLTGSGYTSNINNSGYWNSTAHYTNVNSDSIEFKFYGKYIWVQASWSTNVNVSLTVTIDGGSTGVKTGTKNFVTPFNSLPAWVRLDDGTLSDGVHTVKITRGTAAGTEYMNIQGFGWYSAKADSTLCHDLILGESSYVVGVDDAGFAFTGAGWGAVTDDPVSFLRRWKRTTANGDYFTFTTPNNSNLKAIYALFDENTDKGRIKVTLGASNTRYLNCLTNNYALNTELCLYDSTVDGITLHNKQLKIEKVDGTYMQIAGLIFEIWGTDKVGTNSIKVMQKWSRYNVSSNINTPVSNSYRFSISGLGKTGQDALPVVHSGWCYGAGNAQVYTNWGVNVFEFSGTNYIVNDGLTPIIQTTGVLSVNPSVYGNIQSYTNPAFTLKQSNGSDTTGSWYKIYAQLKRVI